MKSDFALARSANDPVGSLPFGIGQELIAVLRDATEIDVPALFTDAVTWAQTTLVFREFAPSLLARALQALREDVESYVPSICIERAREIVAAAERDVFFVRLEDECAIDESSPLGTCARNYFNLVLDGEAARAAREILAPAVDRSRIFDIYDRILTPALVETGRLWQRNEIGIAQEHAITNIVQRHMTLLVDVAAPRPYGDLCAVTALLGSAQHEVGSRMVADAFALNGWQSTFLGSQVPIDDLLRYVDRVSVDVLAISATLAQDVLPIRDLIAALDKRPVAPLVIVGGRIFERHPDLWRRINADGYARSPHAAVTLARELVA